MYCIVLYRAGQATNKMYSSRVNFTGQPGPDPENLQSFFLGDKTMARMLAATCPVETALLLDEFKVSENAPMRECKNFHDAVYAILYYYTYGYLPQPLVQGAYLNPSVVEREREELRDYKNALEAFYDCVNAHMFQKLKETSQHRRRAADLRPALSVSFVNPNISGPAIFSRMSRASYPVAMPEILDFVTSTISQKSGWGNREYDQNSAISDPGMIVPFIKMQGNNAAQSAYFAPWINNPLTPGAPKTNTKRVERMIRRGLMNWKPALYNVTNSTGLVEGSFVSVHMDDDEIKSTREWPEVRGMVAYNGYSSYDEFLKDFRIGLDPEFKVLQRESGGFAGLTVRAVNIEKLKKESYETTQFKDSDLAFNIDPAKVKDITLAKLKHSDKTFFIQEDNGLRVKFKFTPMRSPYQQYNNRTQLYYISEPADCVWRKLSERWQTHVKDEALTWEVEQTKDNWINECHMPNSAIDDPGTYYFLRENDDNNTITVDKKNMIWKLEIGKEVNNKVVIKYVLNKTQSGSASGGTYQFVLDKSKATIPLHRFYRAEKLRRKKPHLTYFAVYTKKGTNSELITPTKYHLLNILYPVPIELCTPAIRQKITEAIPNNPVNFGTTYSVPTPLHPDHFPVNRMSLAGENGAVFGGQTANKRANQPTPKEAEDIELPMFLRDISDVEYNKDKRTCSYTYLGDYNLPVKITECFIPPHQNAACVWERLVFKNFKPEEEIIIDVKRQVMKSLSLSLDSKIKTDLSRNAGRKLASNLLSPATPFIVSAGGPKNFSVSTMPLDALMASGLLPMGTSTRSSNAQ